MVLLLPIDRSKWSLSLWKMCIGRGTMVWVVSGADCVIEVKTGREMLSSVLRSFETTTTTEACSWA